MAALVALVALSTACLAPTPEPVDSATADASAADAATPFDAPPPTAAAVEAPDAREDVGAPRDAVVAPPRDADAGRDDPPSTPFGQGASPGWVDVPDTAEATDAPPPDVPPLRVAWDVSTSNSEQDGTPAAMAPDGTLYVARRDASGTGRLVRGRPVDGSLVTAFGVDAGVRFRVAAPEGVTVLSNGLAADARGVYLLVHADGPFVLSGVRVEVAPSSCALIALDPQGRLRWAQPLGPAAWDDDARLVGRRDDRLVLVGVATGPVRLGALRVEAAAPRLVAAEVSRDGEPIALRDLADMTGEFARVVSADVNARGDLVALLADPDARYAYLTNRLRRWGPDGRPRWAQAAPRAQVALDDDGNTYVASWGVCSALSGPPGEASCIASLDEAGALRWAARSPLGWNPNPPLPYGDTLVWRQGRLRYAGLWLSRSLWSGISGPSSEQCQSASYGGMGLSLDARGVGERVSWGDGLIRDVLEGGGRRCVVSLLRSVPSSCGGPSPDSATGQVLCDGDRRGCAEGQTPCGGACVDLQSDAVHCGACGRSCAGAFPHASGVCVAGACHYGVCDLGRASCNGSPDDGCEVDVASDPAHCGACDVRCAAGATCEGGRCCVGPWCAPGPFPSDGASGPFAPRADTTLDGALRRVTTAFVPEGVTVRSADNVLRLDAQGEVRIEGTLDLSGRAGRRGCVPGEATAACSPAAPGAAPGADGSIGASGYCGRCGSIPGVVYALHPAYGSGYASAACGGTCGGHNNTAPGVLSYGRDAFDGTIGVDATEDLAVYAVFEPGSRRGTTHLAALTDPGSRRDTSIDYGGGGGGAVRIASATRIVLGPRARILVDGRDGGSGGVIVLHAPEVRVAAGAVVSALGATGAMDEPLASLGRVRVSVDATRCTLDGSFRPPLAAGCRPTPAALAPARTHVTPWPL